MISTKKVSDEKRIYFAGKAVHLYKHFRAKHARATYLVNKAMGVDNTFAPMIRCTSVKLWRSWKLLVVLLEKWNKKNNLEGSKSQILLNTCVVVLSMMIKDEQKRSE